MCKWVFIVTVKQLFQAVTIICCSRHFSTVVVEYAAIIVGTHVSYAAEELFFGQFTRRLNQASSKLLRKR